MLTDAKARNIKPGAKAIAAGGVPGLSLHPAKTAGKGKWILRFVSPETGKRRDMGLGSYPETGIALARRAALQMRETIATGIDPIALRRRDQFASKSQRSMPSFRQAALQVHADISAGFKNRKHAAQWITTLETYAFPHIGHIRVDELMPSDFAAALKSIWLTKPETASRVRQRLDKVMNWCAAHGYITASPVSAVDMLLPRQPKKNERVQHFPAVPWRTLPETAGLLFDNQDMSVGRQALFFLIMTAARSGEVRGMVWDEVDLENHTWTIPAHRMKAGMAHRVPLSLPAALIIEQRLLLASDGPHVFSARNKTPVSDMTLTKVLRDNQIKSDISDRFATAHGFRSTFRDWASENYYPRDLAERALAHQIQNQTEAAYHRTDLLERRRPMMEDWATFVTQRQTAQQSVPNQGQ